MTDAIDYPICAQGCCDDELHPDDHRICAGCRSDGCLRCVTADDCEWCRSTDPDGWDWNDTDRDWQALVAR